MRTTLTNVSDLVAELADLLIQNKWHVTTAESCTGGLLAAALTDMAGSSAWFERSVVTYSNDAKVTMLGVDAQTIEQYGAVSQPVVESMAKGALIKANANLAVSISGVAGPGGGTLDKPVGTVWIAWAHRSTGDSFLTTDGKENDNDHERLGGDLTSLTAQCFYFEGDRSAVRERALEEALRGTIQLVKASQ